MDGFYISPFENTTTICSERSFLMEQEFKEWVASLVKTYKQSQITAAIKVNGEMLLNNYIIGKEIHESIFNKKYGDYFFTNLSEELKTRIPDKLNFSVENLEDIEKFYLLYKDVFSEFLDLLAIVPWTNHKHIVKACSDYKEALFYVQKIIEDQWSEEDLVKQLAKKEKNNE